MVLQESFWFHEKINWYHTNLFGITKVSWCYHKYTVQPILDYFLVLHILVNFLVIPFYFILIYCITYYYEYFVTLIYQILTCDTIIQFFFGNIYLGKKYTNFTE